MAEEVRVRPQILHAELSHPTPSFGFHFAIQYTEHFGKALLSPRVVRESLQVFMKYLRCFVRIARLEQHHTEFLSHRHRPLGWFTIDERIFEPRGFPEMTDRGGQIALCCGNMTGKHLDGNVQHGAGGIEFEPQRPHMRMLLNST